MNEDVFGIPTVEKEAVIPRSRKKTQRQISAERTRLVFNWLNIAAFIAMVAINILANALPLGGNTSAQVSERYPSLFTPAGITFSIWGIIYTVLGIAFIRQIISKKEECRKMTDDIGWLFAISCGLNIGWILCWHLGQITGATLIIFALLANLVLIMLLVRDDTMMSIAFGIYTAWIMVASVASLFVQAAYSGYNMITLDGETLAILAVIIAGIILTLITLISKNWTFAAVGIWSYVGIAVSQVKTYNGEYKLLFGTAVIMTAVMLVSLAYIIMTRERKVYYPIRGSIDEKSPGVIPG